MGLDALVEKAKTLVMESMRLDDEKRGLWIKYYRVLDKHYRTNEKGRMLDAERPDGGKSRGETKRFNEAAHTYNEEHDMLRGEVRRLAGEMEEYIEKKRRLAGEICSLGRMFKSSRANRP